MIYSIDKQLNGKFAIVVLDQDKEGCYIPTVVTDWIEGTFIILYDGKKVGEIGCGSSSCWVTLNLQDTYIEFVFGSIFPHIKTAPGDLLTFKELR